MGTTISVQSGAGRIVYTDLLYFESAFLNRFFDGFLNQLIKPGIVKRLLIPDHRLNLEFQLVMASLAKISMGHVEKISPHNRGWDDTLAYITSKGLHF
jgi:hypothetical protein